nr:hypothetical protein [Tanacetum cinerariifolium]
MEDVFNQGRMIADMDMNEGIELVKDAEVAEFEGRNAPDHAEKQAEIYNMHLDHSLKVLSMQEDDSEVQDVFYMYPRFIQLIIQAPVGDLSTHTIRFISPALSQKVFADMRRVGKGFSWVESPLFEAHVAEDVSHDAIPSPLPHVIPSPSQEPSSPPQQQQYSPHAPPQDAEFPTQLQQVLNVCSALS